MVSPVRSIVPKEHFHVQQLAPGVMLRRLHPGGMIGPNAETRYDIPGGQTWSEAVMLGTPEDDFIMCIPEIRMPPNQLYPLHWHDCWTAVALIEGKCTIGDWHMTTGDVFISAPSIEYGPLQAGPAGCRVLEIFADLALSPGGYSPEYRDHPTMQGGNHVFKPREGINQRNEGHSTLPVDGASGMWKTRLEPGWHWDLGDPDDPDRSIVKDMRLKPGEAVEPRTRDDWYAGLVLHGSMEIEGVTFERDDVLVVERGARVPRIISGPNGVQVLEHFRTSRAL